ncbi:ribose 5-phosphate isomerase B [candidate division KSB1 bacterium]
MLIIGSDHAGFELKESIVEYLRSEKIEVEDIGTKSPESVDYPDFGFKVAESVAEGRFERGILVCGSGVGMSIVANKVPGIRAALCMNTDQAKLCRQHNDANILVLAGRMTDPDTAKDMVKLWLNAGFEGGRHSRRLDKIHNLTNL